MKFSKIMVILTCIIFLAACHTTSHRHSVKNANHQNTQSLGTIKNRCISHKKTHNQLKQKVIPIMWAQIQTSHRNISYEQLQKTWYTLLSYSLKNYYGKTFDNYKILVKANYRKSLKLNCSWSKPKKSDSRRVIKVL